MDSPTVRPAPFFDTVLVANRGEIARRIIRTLRELGIRSVAVYSDADAGAPHVREADVAVRIGPASAAESYLSPAAVLDAARETGAQAVHPGYGFLSENAEFAQACAAAGIVFIGPPADAVHIMGDKALAKEHVAASGVRVVPGFAAAGLSDGEITARAAEIGYPLLVKPAAGGGGKGMEVAGSDVELPAALGSARRIARAAFGDDTLLLERLIERPRHIEVQVLADAHGTTIHLGERECTLQRRHQKVIEEAPSPVVGDAVRARLGAAAIAVAESVAYRGAGTVEFIAAGDHPEDFFFIEMNTRLQVEHPVTEEITGVDLVAAQIRVAAGEPLGLTQDDIVLRGHAVEARVYAETPARDFLPDVGTVSRWSPPRGVRVDAAIEEGSVVGIDYDPMIAKIIAHAPTREAALDRLSAALGATELFGVESNITFLRSLVDDADVRSGAMDTGLIERRAPFPDPAPTAAALGAAARLALPTGEGWTATSGWRLNAPATAARVTLRTSDGVLHHAEPSAGPALRDTRGIWAHDAGATWLFEPLTRAEAATLERARRDRSGAEVEPILRAPMTGTVVAARPSGAVQAGERVVTIEAMKMEHHVVAPAAGTVRVDVAVGDQVGRDQSVAHLEFASIEGDPA